MKLRSTPLVDKLQPLLIDRANVEGVTVKPEFWVVARINPQEKTLQWYAMIVPLEPRNQAPHAGAIDGSFLSSLMAESGRVVAGRKL